MVTATQTLVLVDLDAASDADPEAARDPIRAFERADLSEVITPTERVDGREPCRLSAG